MTNHSIKLTLPPELASQLAALRSARGTTIQVLIRQLLWQALSDRKPGRPAEHPLAAKGKAVYWDLQEHFKKLKAEFASHPRQTLVDFEKLYGPQIHDLEQAFTRADWAWILAFDREIIGSDPKSYSQQKLAFETALTV